MSRNTQRSVKLYETLTSKQKAAVFIELVAAEDADEIERLHSKVERKAYRQFQAWGDRFINVCAIIGMEFWRQSFLRSHTLLLMAEGELPGDVSPETARQAQGKTLALRLVLGTLCDRHGFDHEAACKIATLPSEPIADFAALADMDYFNQWLTELEELLPAA